MKFALETFTLLFLASSLAEASTVLKVFNDELVLLDAGITVGYKKQDEICFYRKDRIRVGCGLIEILEKDRSYVKIERPLAKLIVSGMLATSKAEAAMIEAKKAEEEVKKLTRELELASKRASALAQAAQSAAAQVASLREKAQSAAAQMSENSMSLAAKNAPAVPAAPPTEAVPSEVAEKKPEPPATPTSVPAPEATAKTEPAEESETQAAAPTPADAPEQAAETLPEADLNSSRISAQYLYTLQAPAYFKAISYFSPYDALGSPQSVETLWQQKQVVASSRVGLALSYTRPIEKAQISIGARFRDYGIFTYNADYEADEDVKAKTELKASSYGGYVDYFFYFDRVWQLDAKLGGGVDLDFSNVEMQMWRKTDETSSRLYNYVSNLTVLSARIPFDLAYRFEAFTAHLGGSLVIPFLSSSSYSANVKDTQIESSLRGGDGKADTDSSIAHQASPLAFELSLAASMQF